MQFKSYSKNKPEDGIVSHALSIQIGCALFLAPVLLCIPTYLFRSSVLITLLLALYFCWIVFFIRWLRKRVGHYSEKVSKSRKITGRFQNIAKYFESILQDSTDIIFTVDTEGFILKFNKGAEMQFGYTQEDIVGKPLTILFVNESDKQKVLDGVLLTGKTVNEEIPLKTKPGGIILVNMSMSEMKNDKNQIIGLVVTAKDITERKRLEMELLKKNELLGRLAVTDNLTGLYNSRYFYEQIKRELARLKRNPGRKLTLVMIDVDHFKQLNDSEGHQMGDYTLKSLADVIKVCIRRDVDTAYRYGGDEFILILPDTDKKQARIVTDRIQKQYGSFKFGTTSLSIGIAEANPDEENGPLLRRADDAMYASKREGRGRITLAV